MAKDIPKHFDFAVYERQIYERWIESDAFAAVPDERRIPMSS